MEVGPFLKKGITLGACNTGQECPEGRASPAIPQAVWLELPELGRGLEVGGESSWRELRREPEGRKEGERERGRETEVSRSLPFFLASVHVTRDYFGLGGSG